MCFSNPLYVIKAQPYRTKKRNPFSVALQHFTFVLVDMKNCVVVFIASTVCCVVFARSSPIAMRISARERRSYQDPLNVRAVHSEHHYNHNAAADTNVAHQPTRYSSTHWALPHRFQDPPNAVAVYLPQQYAWIESKPLALPQRFHDAPPVVATYLPSQHPAFSY